MHLCPKINSNFSRSDVPGNFGHKKEGQNTAVVGVGDLDKWRSIILVFQSPYCDIILSSLNLRCCRPDAEPIL